MADTEAEEMQSEETSGNGATDQHDTRKTAVRAAAIAAASGATALAAKRALSSRSSKNDDEGDEDAEQKPARKRGSGGGQGGGDESMLSSVLSSSWESARGSLLPMLEDAATSAGEYVARNAPDVVTDKLVPQFIRGFERGRQDDQSGSSSDDEE